MKQFNILKVILLAMALGIILFALVTIPTSRAMLRRGWLVLTGGLVDVGGYRLRIECSGVGGTTVIMDAGLTFGRKSWDRVSPEVAKFTRVCAYDRAGVGESDPGPTPRTSQQIVNELHALLANARIAGPYILVGHSFGGLNVRLYASEYPNDVVGMVLVDASHEDQYARFAALMSPTDRENYLRREGGENPEHVDLLASAVQVRGAPPLAAMPLIVLSMPPSEQPTNALSTQVQLELQADLARLEPNSTHIIAEKSGHFIQADRPELVVNGIRTVVDAARQQSPALTRTSEDGSKGMMLALSAGVLFLVIAGAARIRSKRHSLRDG